MQPSLLLRQYVHCARRLTAGPANQVWAAKQVWQAAPRLRLVVKKTEFTGEMCASATFLHLFYALYRARIYWQYICPGITVYLPWLREYDYGYS